jgi:hypothetical protein
MVHFLIGLHDHISFNGSKYFIVHCKTLQSRTDRLRKYFERWRGKVGGISVSVVNLVNLTSRKADRCLVRTFSSLVSLRNVVKYSP